MEIVKVTRCSDKGSEMADALSKAEFIKFMDISRGLGFNMADRMASVPVALLNWVSQPIQDWDLGGRILRELSGETDILGYN